MRQQTTEIIMGLSSDMRGVVEKFKRLQEVGAALSAEHDLEKLLAMILKESRLLTCADSGSIYIRDDEIVLDEAATGKDEIVRITPSIVLKVIQNDSREVPLLKEIRLPYSETTIAGHVALGGAILNLPDAYHLPAGVPYSYNRAFDEKSGYRCKSMLAIPMKNRSGETIGVIQLINKKDHPCVKLSDATAVEDHVLPFAELDEDILSSLASQAGICIEKTKLYEEIEKLFESFVTSMTLALEKRNKTTYGHCRRVAGYALALAKAIDRAESGPYADVRYTADQLKEMKYAALLHDIGKIAIPECVLDKRNKLTDPEIATIVYRVALCKERVERNAANAEAARQRSATLDRYLQHIRKINIPAFMSDDDVALLNAIRAETFVDIDGATKPLLTDHEYENLAIRKGNLTKDERVEIERHMTYTWDILKRIPWPRHINHIPQIAATHHEKLNASGYPWGLKAGEIPLGGKILAIVDIFEALTAKDRPYKPAIPVDKALAIVEDEVKRGNLDPEIFRIFKGERIYNMYSNEAGFIQKES